MQGGETTRLDSSHTARVSSFRLDQYEVTVGRFRAFVDAWVDGWRPAAGSGKHTHLNGGAGLSNSNGPSHEPGWDGSWNTQIPTTKAGWDSVLASSCSSAVATWTPTAGSTEKLPQNCLSWYELHAFCLWDGGFLPSEAEWQYAAAGGANDRTYPWGSTPAPDITRAVHGCLWSGTSNCDGLADIAPVGSVPAGNGRWGQSDLAGSVWEWTLDWYKSPYPTSSCNDCANITSASDRVYRGGSFYSVASYLTAGHRNSYPPTYRSDHLAGRCARSAP